MEHEDIPVSGRETAFFAAANTERGFFNGFPALFGGGRIADRLFVVKGGPGTGKSRFMRDAADYAAAHGWRAVFLYCSSDPASLDGVILHASGRPTLALIDGTPPHAWELSRPGVREELIDLGTFWDADALRRSADTIDRLAQEKAAAYRRVYAYLEACGQADDVCGSLAEPLADGEVLRARAERLIRSSLRGARQPDTGAKYADLSPGGTPLPPLFRKAFGMTGLSRLDTIDRAADRVLCVGDRFGLGSRFVRLLYESSVRQGLTVTVTRSPLHPDRMDGILWHDTGLCVLDDTPAGCAQGCQARVMDLRRCADRESLRGLRAELREAASLRDSLLDAALRRFGDVRRAHFALETVYSAAMDFVAKERFTEAFCSRTF